MKIEIDRYGDFCEGIGVIDGKVCFVPYAMKDEIADVSVKGNSKSFCFGKNNKIIKTNGNRVIPACPYYGQCGGCCTMHMADGIANLIKVENAQYKFRKFGYEKEIQIIASNNIFAYRNKVSMPIVNGELGYFENNSHNLIKIDRCLIAKDEINLIVKIFTNFLRTCKNKHKLTHLVVRYLNNQYLICVVGLQEIDISQFEQMLKEENFNYGLFFSIKDKNSNEIFGNTLNYISGIDKIRFKENGLDLFLSVDSFYQVNDAVKSLLYQDISNIIDNKVIIEGYSGIGLLTSILSQNAKHIYSIENNLSCVEDASMIINKNNITNVDIIRGDCEIEIPKIITQTKADTLLVDPPRTGLEKDLPDIINNSDIKEVVYISCNQATLFRDITKLSEYKITNVKLYDMFPQTSHIETMVCLTKNS